MNDKDKEFENSNNKMKLLFGLIAKFNRNFADLISLLSSQLNLYVLKYLSNQSYLKLEIFFEFDVRFYTKERN